MTANFDDVMERALTAAGEQFDVVSYAASGEQRGRFLHRQFGDSKPELIKHPSNYNRLPLDKHMVLVKINGAVNRLDATKDSYVVTEDHYIDYSIDKPFSPLPAPLGAKLRDCYVLFLGCTGMRDWNPRVILHRLWGSPKLVWRSWSVQLDPQAMDQELRRIDKDYWSSSNVDLLDVPLAEFVAELGERMQTLRRAS